MLFSPKARVKIAARFPQSKLDVLNGGHTCDVPCSKCLKPGSTGVVAFVMRTRNDIPGIAVVDWNNGRRTNANEDHLDKE